MKKLNNSYDFEFQKGLTEEEINSPEFNPDDFAPAPDTASNVNENEKIENKRNSLVFAFVVALFALIIGMLCWATAGIMEEHREEALKEEILMCFANCDRVEKFDFDNDNFDVYAVFFRNKIAGYCIHTETDGFAGDIEMLVAFDSANRICKVKILSHNESRGYGSKITEDDFLDQFAGALIGDKDYEYSADMISGATESADAVGREIREILAINGISTSAIATELGVGTISAEEIEEEVQKEEEEKEENSEDQGAPAETTEDADSEGPEDYQGSGNVNNGGDDMSIDGTDVTTVYETETKEPDETTEAVTTEADTTEITTEVTTELETDAQTTEKSPETSSPLFGGDETDETTNTAEETTMPEETTGLPTEETTGPVEQPTEPVDNSQAVIGG